MSEKECVEEEHDDIDLEAALSELIEEGGGEDVCPVLKGDEDGLVDGFDGPCAVLVSGISKSIRDACLLGWRDAAESGAKVLAWRCTNLRECFGKSHDNLSLIHAGDRIGIVHWKPGGPFGFG